MNLPEDTYLTYIVNHEAWYHKDDKRSLNIVASALGGGCAWEFEVTEHMLSLIPAIRLEVFEDAFAAFTQVPELFARLAELEGAGLEDVITILDDLGAQDKTSRRSPYALDLAEPGAGIGHAFVVQWNDGSLSSKAGPEVSYMHDTADCDGMEGVRAIYATDENGNLVIVRTGPPQRDEGFPEDNPVYYARSPLWAGKRVVGHVHHSDH